MTWFDRTRPHTSLPHGYQLWMEPHSAWIFSAWTAPELRGKGLYVDHWCASWPLLSTRGVESVYATILAYNRGSLAAHQKAGFRTVFEARTLCVCGFRCYGIRTFGTTQRRLGFGRLVVGDPDGSMVTAVSPRA
jgi:hypothetical protein